MADYMQPVTERTKDLFKSHYTSKVLNQSIFKNTHSQQKLTRVWLHAVKFSFLQTIWLCSNLMTFHVWLGVRITDITQRRAFLLMLIA
jgi:hypothetical protein